MATPSPLPRGCLWLVNGSAMLCKPGTASLHVKLNQQGVLATSWASVWTLHAIQGPSMSKISALKLHDLKRACPGRSVIDLQSSDTSIWSPGKSLKTMWLVHSPNSASCVRRALKPGNIQEPGDASRQISRQSYSLAAPIQHRLQKIIQCRLQQSTC